MFLFLESISKHPLHVLWPLGGPDPNFGNLWSRWCPAEMIEDFKIEWALLLYPSINIIKMFWHILLHSIPSNERFRSFPQIVLNVFESVKSLRKYFRIVLRGLLTLSTYFNDVRDQLDCWGVNLGEPGTVDNRWLNWKCCHLLDHRRPASWTCSSKDFIMLFWNKSLSIRIPLLATVSTGPGIYGHITRGETICLMGVYVVDLSHLLPHILQVRKNRMRLHLFW